MEESGEESLEVSSSSKCDLESEVKKSPSTSTTIPEKRKWPKLLLHASIMCGREFLYAVEIVLVTPIILQLGMPESYYSFMWCFSPVIGVLIGPILGSQSDRCTSKFGRRRPFIVGLVIGAIFGLTLLIFSKDLSEIFGGTNVESRRLWGVVIGIAGAQCMDFCLDQAETPLRAYTLDVCSPNDQQRAFALQTVFIGVGGALGFIVDGIDWEKTAVSYYFGSQIKVVYIFAVIAYVSTTLCNLFSIKEIPRTQKSSAAVIIPSMSIVPSKPAMLTRVDSVQQKSVGNQLTNGNTVVVVQHTNKDDLDPTSPMVKITSPKHLDGHHLNRPVSMFGRISFSKGLYISTSCPGGLNEQGGSDNSFSSLESDSAYDEDFNANNSSADDVRLGDVSVSLPTLNSIPSKSYGLLDFIRSREFSKVTRSMTSTEMSEMASRNSKPLKDQSGSSDDKKLDSSEDELLGDSSTSSDVKDTIDTDHERTPKVVRSLNPDDEKTELAKKQKRLSRKNKRRKKKKAKNEDAPVSLRHLWLSVVTMPTQLRWLCVAQCLGFVGIEIILLWYTDLMGRVVYKGNPQAALNTTERSNYNAGVKMGCWGLTVYSLAMIIFSCAMERFTLLEKVGVRLLYSCSFLLVVATTTVMFFVTTTEVIVGLSWCVGVTFSVILTVPYVLVGKYHQIKQYVAKSPGGTKRGFGLDCAILACQMYIGNIFSSLFSSPIIHVFGSVRAMLLATGACHLCAFVVAYFLVFYPDQKDPEEADRTA